VQHGGGGPALDRDKSQCKRLFAYCKKCDRKKTTKRGLCGSRQKDRASPALRHAQRADEKGWGFLAAGDCPAELPIMNYQVKT